MTPNPTTNNNSSTKKLVINQGAQSDASSKASSTARTGQSKLEQGADDAEGLGAKIGNQDENLKVCTMSFIYYPTTFQSCI